MSTRQFHGWNIIGALANNFASVGVDQAISRARALEKIAQSFFDRSPTWISLLLTTFSNPFSGTLRTSKKIGKTFLSWVPILSAEKPCFSQGFSHSWPIASAVCTAHAGSVHGACGVAFRVAHRKSSRFSSRASRQNAGVLHVPDWYRSTTAEAVGFD